MNIETLGKKLTVSSISMVSNKNTSIQKRKQNVDVLEHIYPITFWPYMIYTCFHLTFFFLLRNYNFSFPFFKFSSFILLFIRVIFFMKMCVYITVLVVQLIPYLLHAFHVQAHGFYENTGLTDNGQNNKNWISNYVELPKIQIDYSNYMIDIPSTACHWFLRNVLIMCFKVLKLLHNSLSKWNLHLTTS